MLFWQLADPWPVEWSIMRESPSTSLTSPICIIFVRVTTSEHLGTHLSSFCPSVCCAVLKKNPRERVPFGMFWLKGIVSHSWSGQLCWPSTWVFMALLKFPSSLRQAIVYLRSAGNPQKYVLNRAQMCPQLAHSPSLGQQSFTSF